MKKLINLIKINKKVQIAGILAILLLAGAAFFLKGRIIIEDGEVALSNGLATIYYGDASLARGEEVCVDVKLSNFKGEYQAASFQINFDKNRLEFKEIRQGNIEIINKKSGEVVIPEWQYNADTANQKGTISTMYLDMTAEDNPICGSNVTSESDILFRLVFKVKDSYNEGDELTLKTLQATFAAIDENDSLAVYKSNINTPDGVLK
ncbi:MAG: hypothetical protein II193_02810 [Lachnospiraceae bacterium]|nr:hypothetical protein [Lachnospiraceae bacterium]